MRPSETYFYRNLGEWNWNTSFKISSWSKLWSSSIRPSDKVRVAALAFSQLFWGKYSLWTKVDFDPVGNKVHHLTRLRKWGITFLKGEKTFILDPNGSDLILEGQESYWPCLGASRSFSGLRGRVEDDAARARYEMPLLGATCDCKTLLDQTNGLISFGTEWMQGEFELTGESMLVLKQRWATELLAIKE